MCMYVYVCVCMCMYVVNWCIIIVKYFYIGFTHVHHRGISVTDSVGVFGIKCGRLLSLCSCVFLTKTYNG